MDPRGLIWDKFGIKDRGDADAGGGSGVEDDSNRASPPPAIASITFANGVTVRVVELLELASAATVGVVRDVGRNSSRSISSKHSNGSGTKYRFVRGRAHTIAGKLRETEVAAETLASPVHGLGSTGAGGDIEVVIHACGPEWPDLASMTTPTARQGAVAAVKKRIAKTVVAALDQAATAGQETVYFDRTVGISAVVTGSARDPVRRAVFSPPACW